MVNGASTLAINNEIKKKKPLTSWSWEEYWQIRTALAVYKCKPLKSRDEYTLFKEVVLSENPTELAIFRQSEEAKNPEISRDEASGVISPICKASMLNDTTFSSEYNKPFLAPLDIQKNGSVAKVISSFKVIQSDRMSLNIGFDTEFQAFKGGSCRKVLSLQMSIAVGETLIRYFFLVDPSVE